MKQEQVWEFKKYKIDNNQRGLTFIKIQRNIGFLRNRTQNWSTSFPSSDSNKFKQGYRALSIVWWTVTRELQQCQLMKEFKLKYSSSHLSLSLSLEVWRIHARLVWSSEGASQQEVNCISWTLIKLFLLTKLLCKSLSPVKWCYTSILWQVVTSRQEKMINIYTQESIIMQRSGADLTHCSQDTRVTILDTSHPGPIRGQ